MSSETQRGGNVNQNLGFSAWFGTGFLVISKAADLSGQVLRFPDNNSFYGDSLTSEGIKVVDFVLKAPVVFFEVAALAMGVGGLIYAVDIAIMRMQDNKGNVPISRSPSL